MNEIMEASVRSFLGNWFGGPIDCPTREKNYWNGDAAIIAGTAMYFSDCAETFRQWTTYGRKIRSDAVAWRDEEYIVPYEIYRFTGKKSVLRDNYEKMLELIDLRLEQSKGGIWYDASLTYFGDHAVPLHAKNMDARLFSQCFFYLGTKLVAEISDVLGKTEQSRRLQKQACKIRAAFQRNFLVAIESQDENENLGNLVLPLAFGLISGRKGKNLCDKLEMLLEKRKYTINCGAVSAAWLPTVLCRYQKENTAFSVLSISDYPSWGSMIGTGATTTTEYWEGMFSSDEGDSLNHAFKGAAMRCLIEEFAGLKILSPGFERVEIQPCFPQGLTCLCMQYKSPKGQIIIQWERKGNSIVFKGQVPVESVMRFKGNKKQIPAGEYEFILKE